jgi:voltage-gated potassium channel
MDGWKRWLRLIGILVLILVLYFVAPVEATVDSEGVARLVGSLFVFGALAWAMVFQLRMHIDDTTRRIDGLIVGIVLVVVVFSHAFYVLNREDPGQFAGLHTRLDSLYFAVTTLATVGTGDVHAAGQTARALVLLQMVFNVVFVATTASLVTSRIRAAAETRSRERRTKQSGEPQG